MLSGPIFIRFVFFLALLLLFPNPANSVQLRDICRAGILLIGIRAHAVAGDPETSKRECFAGAGTLTPDA
jgi:hypothetical protein